MEPQTITPNTQQTSTETQSPAPMQPVAQPMQTQAPAQPPVQSHSQMQKPISKKGLVIFMTIIALLLAGGCAYLYMQWTSSKDAHKVTQAKLETTEAKLKPARDLQRKKDLNLLKFVILDYKRSTGKFYTTEGTQSRQIFEKDLAPKISDFNDPTSGKTYGYEAIAAVHTPSPLQLGVIQYQWLGKCAADGDFTDTTSEDFAAIRTVLESGQTYCLDL